MRICVPTAGNSGLSEKVYDHFGSAPFYAIYDTSTKSVEFVENLEEHHQGGSCKSSKVMSKYKIDVVITSGMGKRAISLLNEIGIKVFLPDGETLENAIKKFESNQLKELTYLDGCSGKGNKEHNHDHNCH